MWSSWSKKEKHVADEISPVRMTADTVSNTIKLSKSQVLVHLHRQGNGDHVQMVNKFVWLQKDDHNYTVNGRWSSNSSRNILSWKHEWEID